MNFENRQTTKFLKLVCIIKSQSEAKNYIFLFKIPPFGRFSTFFQLFDLKKTYFQNLRIR